ncbi:MAG: prepilin peptidase [Candidatus Liptonbacteria bacterium]|nr:prepilin peptidase [Candidatus Liptonbacteria bacterium]
MFFFYFLIFFFGAAAGSFLNVLSLRYNPDKNLFYNAGGRSRCLGCGEKLCWYELIPLFSFFIQKGRCRHCRQRLLWQYPLIEALCGLLCVFITFKILETSLIYFLPLSTQVFLIILWFLIFLSLVLMSLIDFKLQIIPDEINIFLIVLGFLNLLVYYYLFPFSDIIDLNLKTSFLGSYALLFRFSDILWFNFLLGAVFGGLFFGFLYFITKGQGMGFGDVKLAFSLGLVFGWPDILIISLLAFIIGSFVGLFLMIRQKKKMKDLLPFGPFIALSSFLVFLFGAQILGFYFKLFLV